LNETKRSQKGLLLNEYTISNGFNEILILIFKIEMIQKEVCDIFAFKFNETLVNRNELHEVDEICRFQRVHLEGNNTNDIYKIIELVVHIL
jgi:hypothetical protein